MFGEHHNEKVLSIVIRFFFGGVSNSDLISNDFRTGGFGSVNAGIEESGPLIWLDHLKRIRPIQGEEGENEWDRLLCQIGLL